MSDDVLTEERAMADELEFLSDDWIDALDDAARRRTAPDDDPLAAVSLCIDQIVVDGPRYRLHIEKGSLSVEADPQGEGDIRLTSERETAASIASGARPALDAFIAGDLRIGGEATLLLEHRAREAIGDLFASVRARTIF